MYAEIMRRQGRMTFTENGAVALNSTGDARDSDTDYCMFFYKF